MGAMIRSAGAHFYNPDEAAAKAIAVHPSMTPAEANAWAWHQGKRLLERAISDSLTFAFETTLGGNTMPRMLAEAAAGGAGINIWYLGLEGVELHLSRIAQRVAEGGHDIPAAKVHDRYETSRQNLIMLLPWLRELRLLDNSIDVDLAHGQAPRPRLVLHTKRPAVVSCIQRARVPGWAKPIVQAAVG